MGICGGSFSMAGWRLVKIITYIYKDPFSLELIALYTAVINNNLQLQNTQVPQMYWVKQIQPAHHTHTHACARTHTYTQTHTNQCLVGKRWVLNADLKEEADWENTLFHWRHNYTSLPSSWLYQYMCPVHLHYCNTGSCRFVTKDCFICLQPLTVMELFAKQLIQLWGMSAEKARAIVDKYPTPTRSVSPVTL